MLLSLQFVHELRLFHDKCALETKFDRFITRQRCAGFNKPFGSIYYFPLAQWSPIVKLIESYSGFLTRTLSCRVRNGTGTGS